MQNNAVVLLLTISEDLATRYAIFFFCYCLIRCRFESLVFSVAVTDWYKTTFIAIKGLMPTQHGGKNSLGHVWMGGGGPFKV